MLSFMRVQARVVGDAVVSIAPGLRVPASILAIATGALDADEHPLDEPTSEQLAERLSAPVTNLELGIEYDSNLGRYRVARLEVDAGEREVSGALLRKLRVQEIMRMSCSHLVVDSLGPYSPVYLGSEVLESARRRGPSERILWSVAHIYRAAAICDDNAASAVAQSFEIQPRTATNWIRRARELGMFEKFAPEVAHGID